MKADEPRAIVSRIYEALNEPAKKNIAALVQQLRASPFKDTNAGLTGNRARLPLLILLGCRLFRS
jgi:hypothetical protein